MTDIPYAQHPGANELDRESALDAIRELDGRWKAADEALTVGKLGWRPDLRFKRRVLHLALGDEIPKAWMRRLQAASDIGLEPTVAFGPQVASVRTLAQIQAIDGRIIALDRDDQGAYIARQFRSVADWIAADRIALLPHDLQQLAGESFDRAMAEQTNIKGRYFEEALCLLFSQVSWLTVDEHAYRNATEEIDLVLGIHAVGHVGQLARGAIGIATAKNERAPTNSQTVKYLKEQVANRKGRCRLGFLCSATTISADAQLEILRGSQGNDLLVVQLDGSDFRDLLEQAADLDSAIGDLLRRAANS